MFEKAADVTPPPPPGMTSQRPASYVASLVTVDCHTILVLRHCAQRRMPPVNRVRHDRVSHAQRRFGTDLARGLRLVQTRCASA